MGSFEFLFPALIVLLLSCVQSVFGMGILVFGTPTFLLLGYSFSETPWLIASGFVRNFCCSGRPTQRVQASCIEITLGNLFARNWH